MPNLNDQLKEKKDAQTTHKNPQQEKQVNILFEDIQCQQFGDLTI